MSTKLQEHLMPPTFRLDYAGQVATLTLVVEGQNVQMSKDASLTLIRQIVAHEHTGKRADYITYYGMRYPLVCTKPASEWLFEVWLKRQAQPQASHSH